MVKDLSTLEATISAAMNFDRFILIDQGVKNPRELEVGIMGNHTLYPDSQFCRRTQVYCLMERLRGEISLQKQNASCPRRHSSGDR